jgi:hypothetical protein
MMKKVALILLLFGLMFAEVYLCSTFLPMSWQITIQRVLPKAHDHSLITYPNIEGEIAQAMQHHPGLRLTFYGILIVMVVANTLLLRLTWNILRDSRKSATVPARS